MRSCIGCLAFLVFAAMLLVVGLVFAAAQFGSPLAGWWIEKQTDFPAEMGPVQIDWADTRVELTGINIDNPPEFAPEEDFVQIESIVVDYEPAIFSDQQTFEEITLHVGQVAYVTNQAGEINVQTFRERLQGEPQPPAEEDPPAEPAPEREPVAYLIREMRIQIDEIRMADYSRGGDPVIRTIPANVEVVAKDVKEPSDILGPLQEELVRRGMSALSRELISSLLETGTYQQFLERIGSGASDTIDFGADQIRNLLGGQRDDSSEEGNE